MISEFLPRFLRFVKLRKAVEDSKKVLDNDNFNSNSKHLLSTLNRVLSYFFYIKIIPKYKIIL